MFFNSRQSDDDAAVEEIIQSAVNRARAPNQPSRGNAAGVTGGFSNLTVAPPETGDVGFPEGIYPDEIGVSPNGEYWYPFHLGIDSPNDEFAYTVTGYPTKDYGS